MVRERSEKGVNFPAVWDLSDLFRDDDDPRMEEERRLVEKRSAAFIGKWRNRRDFAEDPAVLRKALDEYEAWSRDCGTDGREGFYFLLRTQQDRNDPGLKARLNMIEEFSRKIQNEIQFFHLRLARIPRSRQGRFLSNPGLAPYRHFLERIFAESPYLLSEAEERILNLKAPVAYEGWVRMTSGLLVKEERPVLTEDGRREVRTFSEILSLMNSQNRRVRDSAARAFNDILKKHAEVAEAEINAILSNKKTDDEIRRMSRPDLGRHISDDIDSGTVDTLIRAVAGRLEIPASYYRLKAGLLGVPRLKYHERNVEYGAIGRKYPFTAAVRMIRRVFKRLDPEFGQILEDFLGKGRFDVFPRKGKTSGAFCVHHLLSQPTYLLLNHTDTLHDVLTLAHELGHGLNNELMRKRQNALNFGSPLSTAEVASTFVEDFVLQELLRGADDELRLSVMANKLNDDVSTIFRQVACYRFEQELHQTFRAKGYLSGEEIGGIFRRHMASYMGDAVEQSPGSENWWVYWGHIRHFFYVYSYASGLLISKALQRSVKEDRRFMTAVKEFLAAGLSDSPKNIFKRLGIDITDERFWHRGIDEVAELLSEAKGLAERLGKISQQPRRARSS